MANKVILMTHTPMEKSYGSAHVDVVFWSHCLAMNAAIKHGDRRYMSQPKSGWSRDKTYQSEAECGKQCDVIGVMYFLMPTDTGSLIVAKLFLHAKINLNSFIYA